MNASAALARLRQLGVPVIETSDAAVALRQSTAAASRTLSRLAAAGLIARVRHGVWATEDIDRLRLAESLTAPLPSYVSFHTALHYHGLIEQIPVVVYAATLARTQRLHTGLAVYSFHHLAPEVFGGFARLPSGAAIATPEKALFDFAYLSAGRSRLFTSLPELELPPTFKRRELAVWLGKVASARSRTVTERALAKFLDAARPR